MLNKQLLTFAIVSVLCCGAVHVEGAKPAKGGGGGGNHMQRGIQLAQEKHFDQAAEEFGKAIQANPKAHWQILQNTSSWRRRMSPVTWNTVRRYPNLNSTMRPWLI